MPGSRAALCGTTLALGLLASTAADGTVVRAMSLADKTEAAVVIVHGTVKRVESGWAIPGALVETRVVIEVRNHAKGPFRAGDHLVVRQPGGNHEGWSQPIPGRFPYETGQELVLFLEPHGTAWMSIALGTGTYEIEAMDGAPWVTLRPRVAELVVGEDGTHSVQTPMEERAPLRWFWSEIQKEVARERATSSSGLRTAPAPTPTPEVTR